MGDKGTQKYDKELRTVPISKIEIWDEANTRHREITKGIDELAASIAEIGLQHPPIVQEENGKYKLISGQRRFLAVIQLGWKELPVLVIKEPLTLFNAKLASISENIHRKPISSSDLADVCDYLYNELGSMKDAAEVLGVSITTFRKYYRYRAVPEELKALVEKKIISVFDARRLSEIVSNVEKAVEFAKLITEFPKTKRERYFAALIDEPEIPLEYLEEQSERYKYKRVLRLYLPDKYARALGRASTTLAAEPESLGLQAVIDWLEDRGWME